MDSKLIKIQLLSLLGTLFIHTKGMVVLILFPTTSINDIVQILCNQLYMVIRENESSCIDGFILVIYIVIYMFRRRLN